MEPVGVPCELCEPPPHAATHWCVDCEQHMCESLAKAHEKSKATKSHTLRAPVETKVPEPAPQCLKQDESATCQKQDESGPDFPPLSASNSQASNASFDSFATANSPSRTSPNSPSNLATVPESPSNKTSNPTTNTTNTTNPVSPKGARVAPESLPRRKSMLEKLEVLAPQDQQTIKQALTAHHALTTVLGALAAVLILLLFLLFLNGWKYGMDTVCRRQLGLSTWHDQCLFMTVTPISTPISLCAMCLWFKRWKVRRQRRKAVAEIAAAAEKKEQVIELQTQHRVNTAKSLKDKDRRSKMLLTGTRGLCSLLALTLFLMTVWGFTLAMLLFLGTPGTMWSYNYETTLMESVIVFDLEDLPRALELGTSGFELQTDFVVDPSRRGVKSSSKVWGVKKKSPTEGIMYLSWCVWPLVKSKDLQEANSTVLSNATVYAFIGCQSWDGCKECSLGDMVPNGNEAILATAYDLVTLQSSPHYDLAVSSLPNSTRVARDAPVLYFSTVDELRADTFERAMTITSIQVFLPLLAGAYFALAHIGSFFHKPRRIVYAMHALVPITVIVAFILGDLHAYRIF